MAEKVPRMARIMLAKLPIAFGLGVVETAYDRTFDVEMLTPDNLEERESSILRYWASREIGLLTSGNLGK
jgi:hypothetical protein